ncbi:hypothetical protein PIB30_037327 [Stylosanthes scabra]|uniref:Uncharacterized protein n=1 Tax=Stylosanthes scabra TaxID=79078 RepID=A0ABU6QDA4_9FABA|nr:hypothetical protein [Stylosanthes scabra]
MARLHDLKLPKSIITGATVRPQYLNGVPARLARPRDGLGAPTRIAVARPRPSTLYSRTNYWKGRAPAPLLPRARVSH